MLHTGALTIWIPWVWLAELLWPHTGPLPIWTPGAWLAGLLWPFNIATYWAIANFDPRGMVGRIIVTMLHCYILGHCQFGPQGHGWQDYCDHLTMLHTGPLTIWTPGAWLAGLLWPFNIATYWAIANFDPRGMVGRIIVTMLHCYILGHCQFGPQGHGWQDYCDHFTLLHTGALPIWTPRGMVGRIIVTI